MLILSDSNPIQFWPIVDDTFNEEDKDAQFIEDYFFYLEFKGDQAIKLKGIDTENKIYKLAIYDENNVLITRLTFTKTFVSPFYVYDLTFSADGISLFESCFKCIVELDTEVVETVETRVSIEEFEIDMDGWTNLSKPSTSIDSLSTALNKPFSGTESNWALGSLPTITYSGNNTRVAAVGMNTLDLYRYAISIELEVIRAGFSADFIVELFQLDGTYAYLNLVSQGITFNVISGNVQTLHFILPPGYGDGNFIGIRISTYSGTIGDVITWNSAVYTAEPETDWIQSSDNSGSLKISTIDTIDRSILLKSGITLPVDDHFIRFKYDSTFATVNLGLQLRFKILDSSDATLANYLIPASISSGEQSYSIPITNATVKSDAAKFQLNLEDTSGSFLAGDFIHVNSIEIYTTEEVTSEVLTPLFKSDASEATENLTTNVLVSYKTNKNFDGIIPTDGDYFTIRIPGRLYHGNTRGDQKLSETSNGINITTYSSLAKTKRFQIDDMPYYMHEKLKSILMFCVTGSLLINGVEWELNSGDSYTYTGDRPDTYPMQSAEIVLSRKNYNKHNVI